MFDNSRASIKAEMCLCRCQILAHDFHDNLPTDVFERLNNVKIYVVLESDISRINNYKIMWYLKNRQPDKAVKHCQTVHTLSKPLTIFDLFSFLRSINDLILTGQSLSSELENTVDFQIKCHNLETAGHPIDLIWREISLFELYRQNKSKAAKAIKKSRSSNTMADSPISSFLAKLLDIHNDYINNPTNNLKILCENRLYSPY